MFMMRPVVLVIENDPAVQDSMKRVLELAGYRAVATRNGSAGLEEFRRTAPALVITDLVMPEKEGIETVIALRKHDGDIRILAIAGGERIGNTDILRVARSLGVDDVLAKPFQPADLIGKVRQLLAGPPA
jgi:CheY-like chemotaxis protein